MKRVLVYFLAGLGCVSCHTTQKESTYITVLADKTSDKISSPQIDIIKEITTDDTHKNGSIHLSYQIIGNTDFNKRYTLVLESYSLLENTLKRKVDINQFYRTIDTLLRQEKDKVYQYQNSSIFIPLIQNLEYLSKVTASKKVVLLYSDIFEFSDIFNCYSKSNKQLLYKNYQAVVEQFKSKLTARDFQGIDLYIIYYPTTIAENRLFQSLYKVYRETFKGTGLKIHIGINKQLKIRR